MKSIIMFCLKYNLPETLMANLRRMCPIAGSVECFSNKCGCAGWRVTGRIK